MLGKSTADLLSAKESTSADFISRLQQLLCQMLKSPVKGQDM